MGAKLNYQSKIYLVFCFKNLTFSLLVSSFGYIFKAKQEIFIITLGKGRSLEASACPSWTEGRAREGKDPSLLTSILIALNHLCTAKREAKPTKNITYTYFFWDIFSPININTVRGFPNKRKYFRRLGWGLPLFC